MTAAVFRNSLWLSSAAVNTGVSGGVALTVTDDEMAHGQSEMARREGIFPAPEGGATVAAARKLVESGYLSPSDTVVLFNTGTGLKYPDIPGLNVV